MVQSAVLAAVGVARRDVAVGCGVDGLGAMALVCAFDVAEPGFVVLGVAPGRLVVLAVVDVDVALLVADASELVEDAGDELVVVLDAAACVGALPPSEEEHPTRNVSGRAARVRRLIMR